MLFNVKTIARLMAVFCGNINYTSWTSLVFIFRNSEENLWIPDTIRRPYLCERQIFISACIGNVGYDPVSSRLVFTTDSPNGEASNSHDQLIPYIPYPVSPENGQPTKINFSALERKSDMKMNGPMTDPETGQTVPILGMTIHPETGSIF